MPDDAHLPPASQLRPRPSYRPGRAAGSLDRATRILLIAVAGVLALLLLLVGYWAISGRHGGGVPTVQADKQPWRTKPENPGGMQVIGANEGGDAPGQPSATAPAPEAPAPEALRAAQPAPPPAPAPVVTAPLPAALPSPGPVPARPAAPRGTSTAAPATAQAGGTFVQLAALDSEAGAHAEWQRLKARLGDVLADRQPVVQRIERDGHALWRLRVGGFPSIADATRFCGRVRAKAGACELALF